MKRKVNHRRKALNEARKAGLDIISLLAPQISKARDVYGTVKHTRAALNHGKKAVKGTIRPKILKLKRVFN